jgi:hypothetical protein
VQDAKARFSKLRAHARPSLKELLLSPEARTDEPVLARRKIKMHPPVELD